MAYHLWRREVNSWTNMLLLGSAEKWILWREYKDSTQCKRYDAHSSEPNVLTSGRPFVPSHIHTHYFHIMSITKEHKPSKSEMIPSKCGLTPESDIFLASVRMVAVGVTRPQLSLTLWDWPQKLCNKTTFKFGRLNVHASSSSSFLLLPSL